MDPLDGGLLRAYPLGGTSIGRCAKKGPSLLYKKSLAREESRGAGTRRGSCKGVKGRCGFSLDTGLPSADRFSASMFSFVAGFPLSDSSHLLPIHASAEEMLFLRRVGAGGTFFLHFFCRKGMTAM